MLNPTKVTITMPDGSQVTGFHLRYLHSGTVVADISQAANLVTANQYVQQLADLNAKVPAASQGADLVLTAAAVNQGGEGPATAGDQTAQVVNPPAAPNSVVLGQ